MRYKLVAFDMDGTLTLGYNSWEMINRYFGAQRAAWHNFEAWDRGEISYPEFVHRDIALWQPVPTIKKIEAILSYYNLAPNVKEVLGEIHRKRYKTAIITSGLDILANEVAKELSIPNVVANGLKVDKRGYLTGEGILRVDPNKKNETLSQLAKDLGVSLEGCVAVGDSKYDAKFLECAGLGVGIGGDSELARVADVVIRDFEHLSRLLDYL